MDGFSLTTLGTFPAYLTAFLAGVTLHLTAFRFGNWDTYTPHFVIGPFVIDGAVSFALTRLAQGSFNFMDCFKATSSLLAICIAGIFTSMLIYRAAFHRLNQFPGPFMARLSNFYVTSLSMKRLRLFKEVQELHRIYGDIVRIGPSEISIADPKAFDLIHSNQSPCEKGPWYNLLYPVMSLQMVKDRKEHARRRKTWDRGFGAKALRDYEPRVSEYTNQLLDKLEDSQGKPLDVATWFNFYSFDVMGDLAFGKGFDMLKDGVVHYYMTAVHENMQIIGALTHLVWIFPLVKVTPVANRAYVKFQTWLYEHVRLRRERKTDATDIFSWLLADYEAISKPSHQEYIDLHGDAELIVVAGSDTTAATLTCLFFELARHPEVATALRTEVDQYFEENEVEAAQSLAKLEYLQACINETLRLYPPVPSGLQRITPPQGLQLDGTFIPGDTIVQVPTYSLHRDERAFSRPNDFIPERWSSKPELIKDASVFAPFSTGRYSCVGKQLALMEVRQVTSKIIRRYSVQLAPDQDADAFIDGLTDGFTLASPTLNMSFITRGSEID